MIPEETEVSENATKTCSLNDGSNLSVMKGVKLFKPHVEVHLRKGVKTSQVEGRISELELLIRNHKGIRNWVPVALESTGDSTCLSNFVHGVIVGCTNFPDSLPLHSLLEAVELDEHNIHFYRLNRDGATNQALSIDEGSDDNPMGSLLWELPCTEFENLWENLVYESDLKNELMSYVNALIQLSDKGADMKVINVNRLIILLGPPGTGKTSLCHAIAQHLSIRLNTRFSSSVMVEINSHSLFSKWFSESGKLVLKMFDQIDELAEDGRTMVFVLIDEVESLGMSRDTSTSRGDPADSIRAVNALLTQIDRIRRRTNVIVLCTSNMDECLDRALLDRADVVKHVGQPSTSALYSVLATCLQELIRIGVVASDEQIPTIMEVRDGKCERNVGHELLELAKLAQGLSGRSIRQVPALAWSRADEECVSLDTCLRLFKEAILEKIELRR